MMRAQVPRETPRLEVRCCCNPQRLYGWLAIPATKRHVGARIYLEAFEKRAAGIVGRVPTDEPTGPAPERIVVQLEVDELTDPERNGGAPFLALKYADEDLKPAEKLRRLKMLQGFEPA